MGEDANYFERPPRKEVLRLLSMRMVVPDDEEIARVEEEYGFRPRPQLNLVWEPLSYEIRGGKYGNQETDRLPMTQGRDDFTDEQYAAFRERFRLALPSNRAITVSKKGRKAHGSKEHRFHRPFERWFERSVRQAGLNITVNEGHRDDLPTGQIFSADEGTIWEVEQLEDDFPGWDEDLGKRGGWNYEHENARGQWMRYAVAQLDEYEIPEDRPVREIPDDDAGKEASSAMSAMAGQGVSAESLAAELKAAGIIGLKAVDFETPAQQMTVSTSRASKAPSLLLPEFSAAAQDGGLLKILTDLGACAVVEGVIVEAP